MARSARTLSFPHPNRETLGGGGLIAASAASHGAAFDMLMTLGFPNP